MLIVDLRAIEEKEVTIRREFIRNDAPKKYGLDAYLLIVYPEGHTLRSYTRSNILY